MFAEEYTPRRRGFDTFMGMFIGAEDYFMHVRLGGLDLRRNGQVCIPGFCMIYLVGRKIGN